MAKYIKKPITVDAEPYEFGMEHGCDFYAMGSRKFLCTLSRKEMDEKGYPKSMREAFFNTKQGKVFVKEGDMVITQEDGEQYPCDIANFNLTYKKVEE